MDRYTPRDRRNHGRLDHRDHIQRNGPSTQLNAYRFGGREAYRTGGGGSYRPDKRNEFSFRSSSNLPQSSRQPPSGPRNVPDRFGSRSNGSNEQRPYRQRQRDGKDRFTDRRPQRRHWKPAPPTSARPLLQGYREQTPEQLRGMSDGAVRFKAIEDLSDSGDEPMVMDSDAENPDESPVADSEPPRKVVREEAKSATARNDGVPQWSNPDPYTSLPLSTEVPAKKKDVVQLIRKAKAQTANGHGMENQNEDFISFNWEDENDNHSTEEDQQMGSLNVRTSTIPQSVAKSTANAPKSPSSQRASAASSSSIPLRFEFHKPPPKPPPGVREALSAQLSSNLDNTLPPPPPPSSSFYNSYPRNLRNNKNSASPPLPTLPPPSLGFAPPLNSRTENKRKLQDEGSSRRRPAKLNRLHVHPRWLPKRDTFDILRIPWLTVDHSNTFDVSLRLHREICDFYDYLKPREFENAIRQDLVSRLSNFISQRYSGAEIRYFGSFASGLYLPDGDMDLVMLSQDFIKNGKKVLGQNKKAIRKLGQQLKEAGISRDGSLAMIFGAKVPIIKFVDQRTGLRVDISFENDTGLIANTTCLSWKVQYPAMPVLVTLVKQFLVMHDLNEVHTGGLGGFAVTCLVVSCMQHMPQLQSGTIDAMQNLGEVFMTFLDLYGNQFNTTMTGIELEPPRYFQKQKHSLFNANKPSSLCIVDPNKSDNDISAGSHNVLTAFKSFSMAFECLTQEMGSLKTCAPSERKGSILGCLFAGNYEQYENRRALLKALYKK